jgi:ABC-type multidrug transport system fused ATPase/permease subunit
LQVLGLGQKLWIKVRFFPHLEPLETHSFMQVWSEAYGAYNYLQVPYISQRFARVEHAFSIDHPRPMIFHPALHLQGDWPDASEHLFYYICIFAAIGSTASVVSVLAYIVQLTGALRASRILFKRLLVTVVHATMRWHDVTPKGKTRTMFIPTEKRASWVITGRVLNRFGKVCVHFSSCISRLPTVSKKDMETIDDDLANSLHDVNNAFATLLVATLTVACVIQYNFCTTSFFIKMSFALQLFLSRIRDPRSHSRDALSLPCCNVSQHRP